MREKSAGLLLATCACFRLYDPGFLSLKLREHLDLIKNDLT